MNARAGGGVGDLIVVLDVIDEGGVRKPERERWGATPLTNAPSGRS